MDKGDIVVGKITGIKDYGAFVSLDESSGLIHISEFSDGYVGDISNIISVGDLVTCEVIDFDTDSNRFKLSYKKCNLKPSKAHKQIKIVRGFNPLGISMDKWVEDGLRKYNKGN